MASNPTKSQFKSHEIPVLAGHLNFALIATVGRASRAFAGAVYDSIEGTAQEQPPHAYRATQWLEAILQKPPPRIERTEFAKHHILLPDGYWDPDKKEGGVGSVLLREGATPYTFGGMVPEHLTFQLLSMQETEEAKTQRNTQAELLAILMSILM